LAEAGTGTGKTLAYLVPALLGGQKALISTATKHLQEQILGHDLPLAQKALGKGVDVALMKGRTNYLCELRAEVAMAQPGRSPHQQALLRQVAAWRTHTQTGDRAELDSMEDASGLWRELTATSDQCVGRMCPHFERCWVVHMRRRAQEADVVVVNHHLFFADAALGGGRRGDAKGQSMALLPPFDLAIFDEAHELDDIATQHYGHQVSERRMGDIATDLLRAAGSDQALLARLSRPLERLQALGQGLFAKLPEQVGRVRTDAVLPDAHIEAHLGPMEDQLAELETVLSQDDDDEIRALTGRVAALGQSLATVLGRTPRASLVQAADAPAEAPGGATFVRYTEGYLGHRALAARPVDVSHLLGALFAKQPTVFVSATLRMGDSFEHSKRRLGLPRAKTLSVDSPFDYPSQVSLYIATDVPDPDAPDFLSAAARCTQKLVSASGGGAFVLCTSHRSVQAMCQALRGAGVPHVLVQGEAPKSHLVDSFRQLRDGVLVATASFWRGVDVPGDALRLVVIDKLPFASPFDPLVQARLAQLQEEGLDPFMHHQLPQASMMLRQGFGRLIRKRSDRGLVAILDRRLTTRRYGPLLIDALPPCPQLSTLQQAEAYLESQRPQGPKVTP
jgi:ATP-dependent DNA helicase DinG